jgi:hypothetical protein
MNCKNCQSALPDLLLEPAASGQASAGANKAAFKNKAAVAEERFAAARAHLATCAECAEEFASLAATVALLDVWDSREVSPYFDQKLAVRLREEQAAPPAGWFERLRDRLLLNTGSQFRPAVMGALAVALIVGGGSFGISTMPAHPHPAVQASAAVNDLQILDKNEQALQQMDQLLQDDAPDNSQPATPPRS